MIVLGITGSIGMGKSTVAQMLRDMGIPVHDADAAVHELLGPDGGAVAAVAQAFPETLKSDTQSRNYIDRQTLGALVFSDAEKKHLLENILHPLVREDSDRFKQDMHQKGHAIIALDIPLLFETGGENRVDVTLCVSAPPDIQRDRVLARPGMTAEKFERILAGQLPDSEKRARADFVIESHKGLEDMRQQLQNTIHKIKTGGPDGPKSGDPYARNCP